MNLGQYIKRLLLENDTVIIPGFGAFVSKYKSAEISEDSGEISPPSKEISFNQQIRNNDGLLVEHVAENEFLSHFDALKLIEKERENIVYQLDKGEKILLDKTGILFINDKLEIQFESLIDENLLLDSFGLEPVNPFEEMPENTEDKTTENEFEENSQDSPEKLEESNKNTGIQQEKKLFINQSSEISSEAFENEIANQELDTIFEPIISAEPGLKKKKNRMWYFLLLIPIIFTFFYVVSNKTDKDKSPETLQNTGIAEEASKALPIVDSTKVMVIDSTQIAENELNTIEIISDDLAKFYLVGGSFKEEENAQKFIEQFDVEDYIPFNMGRIGNFYFIGIGKFNSEREAYQAKIDFMEKNPNSETWVYEKK